MKVVSEYYKFTSNTVYTLDGEATPIGFQKVNDSVIKIYFQVIYSDYRTNFIFNTTYINKEFPSDQNILGIVDDKVIIYN
jgi:hypothetical protein